MDNLNNDLLMPKWAIRKSNTTFLDLSYSEIGAQLLTRDGRKTGNAFVNSLKMHKHVDMFVEIVTDAGSKVTLTIGELKELFYPPEYIMDINEARRKFLKE